MRSATGAGDLPVPGDARIGRRGHRGFRGNHVRGTPPVPVATGDCVGSLLNHSVKRRSLHVTRRKRSPAVGAEKPPDRNAIVRRSAREYRRIRPRYHRIVPVGLPADRAVAARGEPRVPLGRDDGAGRRASYRLGVRPEHGLLRGSSRVAPTILTSRSSPVSTPAAPARRLGNCGVPPFTRARSKPRRTARRGPNCHPRRATASPRPGRHR